METTILLQDRLGLRRIVERKMETSVGFVDFVELGGVWGFPKIRDDKPKVYTGFRVWDLGFRV